MQAKRDAAIAIGISPRTRGLLELALVAGLFLFALALRLPYFESVPALTDEFKHGNWALDAYKGLHTPLVGGELYTGPFYTYLLVFLFRLFGPSIFLPRLLVLVLGALTVPVAYLFGKTLARGDWRVGAASAFLYAVNAHHIFFNSHVAWSNDITPLFTTLALWLYIYATRYARPVWLIGAGVLFGIAVQTHPSIFALALAFPIDFLLRRETRALLKRPYPYLAVLAAMLLYSPVLYYNWQTGFGSLQSASEAEYAFELAPSLVGTLEALPSHVVALGRVAVGSFQDAPLGALLLDPTILLCISATAAAWVWMARRGESFLLIAGASSLIVLAVFNRYTAIPDSARYFQFLLPLIFVAWSQAGVWLVEMLTPRGAAWRWAGWVAFAGVIVALSALSLVSLQQYYAQILAAGRDNRGIIEMVTSSREPSEAPILIEWKLADVRTGRGGNIAENLRYLFRLDGRQAVLVSTSAPDALGGLQNYLREHETAYLIGFENTPAELGDEFPLQPILTTQFPCPSCPSPDTFTLYWWEQP